MTATVVSVNVSAAKGVRKRSAEGAELQAAHGIVGDAHAGDWHRQVSLLAAESIESMRALGLDVGPGDFAENITTSGIDLLALPIGARVRVGGALLRITQHGKECHTRCAIYQQAGDCVMPREGVFTAVEEGGRVAPGDAIEVVGDVARA